MEFNWRNSREKMLADEAELAQLDYDTQKAHEMDQLIQANANATTQINGFRNQMSDATQQVQKQMVADENVERQRWMELEREEAERRGRFQNDPRMQMAAMLAMGGQPGALQNLLVSSVQQDIAKEEKERAAQKQLQSQMDALENGINNDLMYLAGMNNDQRDKVLAVSLPLFRAKMQELEDAGAVSRMGGMEAWDKIIENFKKKGQKKKANAKRSKETKEQQGNAVFSPR